MQFGVLGINYKLADLKLREQLAKSCQKRFGAIYSFPEHHFVLLSTCNRTELYFSSHDLSFTHSFLLGMLRLDIQEEFDQKLYSFFGVDCFTHLSRVAAGLDSAVLAESEIQGQVKAAYEQASEEKTLPKELHFLFQKSLGIAKKIRTQLNLGRGMPTLEQAVLQTGKCFFNGSTNFRVLFVGASEINQKILHYLHQKGVASLFLCNRSDEIAFRVAKENNITAVEWGQLASWPDYDWIILGTKSPEYLITAVEYPKGLLKQKNRLIMDLSVPRNVDPLLGRIPGITLLNIDQINRMLRIRHRSLKQTLCEAESRISESTVRQSQLLRQKEASRKFLSERPSKIEHLSETLLKIS